MQLEQRPHGVVGETVDISPPVGNEQEMLHCAASQGFTDSVQALLADGRTHPDVQDRFGRTALHWAAGQGHLETVVVLSSTGASIDPRSRCNATPLMLAALGGHDNVVRHLLHIGAGLPCVHYDSDSYGHAEWRTTALHYAARGGHVGVVRTLLSAGFRRDQHDEAGLTPAEISARSRSASSPAVTRLLLDDSGGGKMVHDYVDMVMEDVEIVRGLALGGAFLDWQDQLHRRTPLHRAVHFRHFQILKILLQTGANPNLKDRYGITPLHLVAISGCTAGASELLPAGADTTIRCHDSCTPLHMSVAFNRVGVTRLLLGASRSAIEIRETYLGITPLAWASKQGFTPMLRVLLEAGADVESRSFAGLTPLHWACRACSLESVESLLRAGADLDAVDVLGAVASSVVGLGDPVGYTGPDAPHFTADAMREPQRPSDSPASNRIRSALRSARRDRAWRRRGWLVVLASRRALGTTSRGIGTRKRVALCASATVPETEPAVTWTETRRADGVERQQGVREEEGGGTDGAPRFYGGTVDGSRGVHEPSRDQYGNAVWKQAMSSSDECRADVFGGIWGPGVWRCQPRVCRLGGAESLDDVAAASTEEGLIEALLESAGVEGGVFRNVLSFIY